MHIEYRRADRIQDIIDLLMLRVEVFVVEQGGPHDEEPDHYDKEATFIVANVEGRIVGTARFRWVGEQVKIERIAVQKEYRQQGIGAGLVQHVLQQVRREQPTSVFLHAQTVAEEFYTKLGFQPVGETFMEAGIEHIKMIREI
jgi:predicted GNAT family N-acyltransferase